VGSNEAEYLEVIVGFEDRWEIHDGMDGGGLFYDVFL
jgi:hypothetical protein